MNFSQITIKLALGTAFVLVGGLFETRAAVVLTPGGYGLQNHPDGDKVPPLYGLRLDELIDVTGGNDVFTFDFDHASSNMRLDLSASAARIHGVTYGGRDIGSAYDPAWATVWTVDFTYQNVTGVTGDDDLWVKTTPNGVGAVSGTISGTIGSTTYTYELRPKADGSGLMFRLGNENNDLGHRGHPGVSGWGWLQHLEYSVPGSGVWQSGQFSDWLFVVVPEPATWTAGMVALLLSGCSIWRRKAVAA